MDVLFDKGIYLFCRAKAGLRSSLSDESIPGLSGRVARFIIPELRGETSFLYGFALRARQLSEVLSSEVYQG